MATFTLTACAMPAAATAWFVAFCAKEQGFPGTVSTTVPLMTAEGRVGNVTSMEGDGEGAGEGDVDEGGEGEGKGEGEDEGEGDVENELLELLKGVVGNV